MSCDVARSLLPLRRRRSLSHELQPLHLRKVHLVAQLRLSLTYQLLHFPCPWLSVLLHSPHRLQSFHVHFLDQLLLSVAHILLQRFCSSMNFAEADVFKGANVADVESGAGDVGAGVVSQWRDDNWLFPEKNKSSATCPQCRQTDPVAPGRLSNTTEKFAVSTKSRETAAFCCALVITSGSVGSVKLSLAPNNFVP